MPSIRKITPADYPELLAAVDAGVTQRQLARRYNCAPSLIARHVAKARQAQEFSAVGQEPDVDATADEVTNSLREIMEARIRDPNTSARDLASLANAVTRLKDDGKSASAPPITSLRIPLVVARAWRHQACFRALLRSDCCACPVLAPLRTRGRARPDAGGARVYSRRRRRGNDAKAVNMAAAPSGVPRIHSALVTSDSADRRGTNSARVGPAPRDEPAKQCRRRDHERVRARSRQQPAGGGKEDSIRGEGFQNYGSPGKRGVPRVNQSFETLQGLRSRSRTRST